MRYLISLLSLMALSFPAYAEDMLVTFKVVELLPPTLSANHEVVPVFFDVTVRNNGGRQLFDLRVKPTTSIPATKEIFDSLPPQTAAVGHLETLLDRRALLPGEQLIWNVEYLNEEGEENSVLVPGERE